jgi:integrase
MFAARRLQELSARDLDALISVMLTEPTSNGRPRGPRTVALTMSVLRHTLRDAARRGLVTRNEAELVESPRQRRTEQNTWTLAELRTFLVSVENDRLRAVWLLSARGLRRGEVLGLKSAVNLSTRQTLDVLETRVLVTGSSVVVSEPKTARGRRTLPLDEDLAEALRKLKALQADEAALAGQG